MASDETFGIFKLSYSTDAFIYRQHFQTYLPSLHYGWMYHS
jgi:hypothetical protein